MKGGNGIDYGFIAQEVESAIGKKTNIVLTDNTEFGMKTLRYVSLLSPLTKAIQEQQEVIEEYKNIIEEYEKRVEYLEKENIQLNNHFKLLLKHLNIEYIKKTTTDGVGNKNEVESFQPIKKQKKAKKDCECYED